MTAEATNITDVACPPTHPKDVDRGYLRGLKTLKIYFQRIWKELYPDEWQEKMEESRGYSGGEGVAAAETEAETMDVEDDAGEVSVGQRARVKTDTRVILNCMRSSEMVRSLASQSCDECWKSRGKESCTSTR